MTVEVQQRLQAIEKRLRALQLAYIATVALAVCGGGVVARWVCQASARETRPEPWRVGREGDIVFAGEVRAARFVAIDHEGNRCVVLGDPGGVDAGPGVHIYSLGGHAPVAALWREGFAGRSRLIVGDEGVRPLNVIGNGPRTLLIAPEIVTEQSPTVRPPSVPPNE